MRAARIRIGTILAKTEQALRPGHAPIDEFHDFCQEHAFWFSGQTVATTCAAACLYQAGVAQCQQELREVVCRHSGSCGKLPSADGFVRWRRRELRQSAQRVLGGCRKHSYLCIIA